MLQLLPLTMGELKQLPATYQLNDYLWRGFYPKIYDKKLNPTSTYKYYFETYIQRDLRELIAVKDLHAFRKFVKLCAGRIGQIFVASNLANELGLSVPTIQSWLSILEASYIAFLLEPYHVNRGKRLVKSPKLYFYDVGLATYLLGIEKKAQLDRDPLRGALVENLVVSELLKTRYNQGLDHNLFFYRDSNLNEVDVLFKKGNTLIPIEIKSSTTFTSSFLKGLEHIRKVFPGSVKGGYLVYGGTTEQNVGGISVINFSNCAVALK